MAAGCVLHPPPPPAHRDDGNTLCGTRPCALVYVCWPTGTGKSTVLEAIVWAIFRRTLRSDMRVAEVINNKAKGAKMPCVVRLDFENGYSVTRTRVPKGLTLEVEKDGQLLDAMNKGNPSARQVGRNRARELSCKPSNTCWPCQTTGPHLCPAVLAGSLKSRRRTQRQRLPLTIPTPGAFH